MSLSDSMIADAGSAQNNSQQSSNKLSLSQQMMADANASKPQLTKSNVNKTAQQKQPVEEPNAVMSALAGAGKYFGSSILALQQLAGKGLSTVGDYLGNPNATPGVTGNALQNIGGFLQSDALTGAQNLEAQNAPYEEAHPYANAGGGVVGLIASPVNKLVPGMGGPANTLVGAIGKGGVQGAVLNTLSSPALDENQSFLVQKAQQALAGGVGGAVGGGLVHGVGAGLSAGANLIGKFKNQISSAITPDSGAVAENAVKDAIQNNGLNVANASPEVMNSLKNDVQKTINAGDALDEAALARKVKAETLPVPVYQLRGQLTRDPMDYTRDIELAKDQKIGKEVNDALVAQNKAFIDNLTALGAKKPNDPIAAGADLIGGLKSAYKAAEQEVSNNYNAFRNATGKDLQVPLQGLAQDYANILNEYGKAGAGGGVIPAGITNQFESLGLMSGSTKKMFSIQDAEKLIKTINKNYDSNNQSLINAGNELRQAVQRAITEGAGEDVIGTDAANLALQARQSAKKLFDLTDTTPALEAATKEEIQPDKFIDKYIFKGNVGQINNMVQFLKNHDPASLENLRTNVMSMIKGIATSNAPEDKAIISNANMNDFINDPNMSARLESILGTDKMSQLRQLKDVMDDSLKPPVYSAINRSNTASAAKNLIDAEISGGNANALLNQIHNIPVVGPTLSPFTKATQESVQNELTKKLIDKVVNPSVSAKTSTFLNPAGSLEQNLLLQKIFNQSNNNAQKIGRNIGIQYLNNVHRNSQKLNNSENAQ